MNLFQICQIKQRSLKLRRTNFAFNYILTLKINNIAIYNFTLKKVYPIISNSKYLHQSFKKHSIEIMKRFNLENDHQAVSFTSWNKVLYYTDKRWLQNDT